jgi:hypothetical protein
LLIQEQAGRRGDKRGEGLVHLVHTIAAAAGDRDSAGKEEEIGRGERGGASRKRGCVGSYRSDQLGHSSTDYGLPFQPNPAGID